MSFALNPSFNSLIAITYDLNYIRRVSCLMYLTVPYFITEHMGMYRLSPGRLRIFWTEAVAVHNGHSTGSPVYSCVFMSIFLPLFWSSKVRDTAWEWKVPESLKSISSSCTPQNSMFWILIRYITISPFVVFTYSQDLVVKKNTRTERFFIDVCIPVMDLWNNWGSKKGVKTILLCRWVLVLVAS